MRQTVIAVAPSWVGSHVDVSRSDSRLTFLVISNRLAARYRLIGLGFGFAGVLLSVLLIILDLYIGMGLSGLRFKDIVVALGGPLVCVLVSIAFLFAASCTGKPFRIHLDLDVCSLSLEPHVSKMQIMPHLVQFRRFVMKYKSVDIKVTNIIWSSSKKVLSIVARDDSRAVEFAVGTLDCDPKHGSSETLLNSIANTFSVSSCG